ncbi:MAG: hypothetical protein M3Y83_12440 [Actinomycetota bacterium]|nr:hypothetical protein [Actinomycetota bacterium]
MSTGSESVISANSIVEDLYPGYFAYAGYEPHLDSAAQRMNELRGLILGQCSETERVIRSILTTLKVDVEARTPAGALRKMLDAYCNEHRAGEFSDEREVIAKAVEIRNRVAHEPLEIGSVWRDLGRGDYQLEPMISLLGGEVYDEADMVNDLAVQQEATRAAVRVQAAVEGWDRQVEELRLETAEEFRNDG